MGCISKNGTVICSADGLNRGRFGRGEYEFVILSLTVLRGIDYVKRQRGPGGAPRGG